MINILFQAYRTLEDENVTTIAGLLTYVAGEDPVFVPMLLFSLFIIMTLATYYSQIRLRGEGNFFGSLAVSGYFTFIVSIVMSLIPGLVNLFTIGVCLAVSVGATLLFLLTKDQ